MPESNPTDELAATRSALVASQAALRAVEEAATRSAVDASVATVLSNYELLPGAAAQIQELLRGQVTVYKDANGELRPTGPEFKPVGEWIKAKLETPEFSHFHRGSKLPTSPTANTPYPNVPYLPQGAAGAAAAPKNLGEALIVHQIANQPVRTGDPRLDISQPLGLGRPRK